MLANHLGDQDPPRVILVQEPAHQLGRTPAATPQWNLFHRVRRPVPAGQLGSVILSGVSAKMAV